MRGATERLLELGLSEKEARVYLAMLELGSAKPPELAKKAGVNRSTAYFVVEALRKRGLALPDPNGDATAFVAESPDRLPSLVDAAVADLAAKRRRIEEAMPEFLALFNAMPGKPSVRFYEGEEGVVAVREAMDRATEYGDSLLSFTAVDEGALQMAKIMERQRFKLSRKLKGRAVFAVKPGIAMPEMDVPGWELREIPYARRPFTGEINILGSIAAAFTVREKPLAVLVDHPALADLFRALFDAAWHAAAPYGSKK
jgi:hypothetical protein